MSKTLLVTGGTQGIGKAIATEFAKNGYNVAFTCSSEKSLETKGKQLASELAALGVKAKGYAFDVGDFSQCEAAIKQIKEDFETINVLINNAGMTNDGLLVRMSEEQFDSVITTNLKGVFNVTRQVAPIMFKKRSGKIINISSVTGVHGNAGQFNYTAAKAGIIGMTKTAAKELGARGITVNAIAPGFVVTPMTDVLKDDIKELILKNIPLGRFGEATEIAKTALFLASDGADYITGQVIEVNGGLAM
ncbi:MAG: 3-oxoacyl-[acyl-carrier-protein] reductase [Oscillospiraceae bacterium]